MPIAAVNHKATRRICIIAQSNAFGGAEVHTLGLIKMLIRRGHHVDLIACRNHEYDDRLRKDGLEDSVRIIHTELNVNDTRVVGALEWTILLRSLSRDILIFPKSWYLVGSLTLHCLFRILFGKVFIIEHLEAEAFTSGDWQHPFEFFRRHTVIMHWLRIKRRTTAYLVDNVIAVSEKVKDRLIKDWAYPTDRIIVIKNGVDCRELIRDEVSRRRFRVEHDIPSDALVYGMLARLCPEKGIDIAIQAMHQLVHKKNTKKICLVVAGEGPERERLVNLIKTLEIENYVKFIGFVSNPKDAVSAFDVILFSSRLEGLPLGLLEGMAAGCIPIVTRVSGMPEVISDPQIGWVVTPDSPDELCAAMQGVLDFDEGQFKQMQKNAIRKVQDDFDLCKCHTEIAAVCGV